MRAKPTVETKQCRECGKELPAEMFGRSPMTVTGLSTNCKPCSKTRSKRSRCMTHQGTGRQGMRT